MVNGWTQVLESQAQTSTIPEPSTWVMMLLGFAALGFACYCKTRSRPSIA
jgi:hypothetical protein